jgi:hypothetical protein
MGGHYDSTARIDSTGHARSPGIGCCRAARRCVMNAVIPAAMARRLMARMLAKTVATAATASKQCGGSHAPDSSIARCTRPSADLFDFGLKEKLLTRRLQAWIPDHERAAAGKGRRSARTSPGRNASKDSNSEMSVFCNLGRTPWVYRAFSYQRLFADAEKGPMQIALGQSDICEFESYMPSHAVWSPPLDSALSQCAHLGQKTAHRQRKRI